MLSDSELHQLGETLDGAEPRTVVRAAADFERLGVAFSGAEDVVLIDMVAELAPHAQIFCLDTGRLHPATQRFIEQIRQRYGRRIEMLSPDAAAVEALVAAKGAFSFYTDGHAECCAIRKLAPLRRRLGSLDAWITGQRRDQSPTRSAVDLVERDPAFATPQQPLVKFNPLAHWSLQDVWTYIRSFDVPYNPLHDEGYVSIGCEPCTRPLRPGEHERAGRWWWEEATRKECGLHVTTLREADIRRASGG